MLRPRDLRGLLIDPHLGPELAYIGDLGDAPKRRAWAGPDAEREVLLFRDSGLSWRDVVRLPGSSTTGARKPDRRRRKSDLPNHRVMASDRLAAHFLLTAWEIDFCAAVKHRDWLSPRQYRVLVRLWRRCTKTQGGPA